MTASKNNEKSYWSLKFNLSNMTDIEHIAFSNSVNNHLLVIGALVRHGL